MSLTTRLFTARDLNRIENGKDNHLGTVFANKKNFSELEMKTLQKIDDKLKMFNIDFGTDIVGVKAFDVESLKWFVQQEFKVTHICEVVEVIISTIPVSFEDWEN